MPRIFDNIELPLVGALKDTLKVSERADFCVGYFNLRGWKHIDTYIEDWSGPGQKCRLLVGMQRLPHDQLKEAMSLIKNEDGVDQQIAIRIKKKLAEEFRHQLCFGAPTNDDEKALQRLAGQIRDKKVVVKLFLRNPLHAKLYLLFRKDPINPIVGYLGSSNLTFSGLAGQGELNVDVLDNDACQKLVRWFEDRWKDRLCLDISEELLQLIEESWAREELISPYHIYLNIAYHLSQEARAGLTEFSIPRDFKEKLFDFQTAAVFIAAHHLNKRNGVLIGDVVGLGKTIMATAVARIFDDFGLDTLIICPKNLVAMWEDYRDRYRLRAKVISISRVIKELPEMRRYRLVLIDESHNLRNREGKRFRAIQEYIRANDSKCILLSATPYNKTYHDLSNQLRLFLPEDTDIGIRPERLLKELGETEFVRRHQCPVRSLAAFDKSEYPDDWQELMRLYLVRRTRSFIKDNYAEVDLDDGRKYLVYEDGSKSFFPDRVPKTITFPVDDQDPTDQYAGLFDTPVVDAVNDLALPRYGLGNYQLRKPKAPPTPKEIRILKDLSRAGKRLMGFCRTGLFKRLESSGYSFLLSIQRHILRNFVYLHAIENDLPLPLGTQTAEYLDSRFNDEDREDLLDDQVDNDDIDETEDQTNSLLTSERDFRARAALVYEEYRGKYKKRFKWIRSDLFSKQLAKDLKKDANALIKLLMDCGDWEPDRDEKLTALYELLTERHPGQKILVFTQFADTVRYLEEQLKLKDVCDVAGVTGDTADPTAMAWRFSPESNQKENRFPPDDQLRILVATDVLSEGQNLQDCAIVVNYDLPWAIIRLIQRAGRVDRIGQKADNILCYSFLPAEGVERIIRLRARVRQRLHENAEVVGADEAFFEDDDDSQTILNLYHERAGILDGDDDTEVDLASYAYQIWKNAITVNPKLKKKVSELPPVAYSSRDHQPTVLLPEGVLVYLRTAEGNDALAYIDKEGRSITESQFEILKIAECAPKTTAYPRHEKHHDLVQQSVRHIVREEKRVGGQLGRPTGARFRTYERLKRYADSLKDTLFEPVSKPLLTALDEIYRYPLRQSAVDILNRQLKAGIDDIQLAELVTGLREDDRLCLIEEDSMLQEPRIICSLGLFKQENEG